MNFPPKKSMHVYALNVFTQKMWFWTKLFYRFKKSSSKEKIYQSQTSKKTCFIISFIINVYINICNPNKLSICITNVNLQALDFFDNWSLGIGRQHCQYLGACLINYFNAFMIFWPTSLFMLTKVLVALPIPSDYNLLTILVPINPSTIQSISFQGNWRHQQYPQTQWHSTQHTSRNL
jgi:hypothetical protein